MINVSHVNEELIFQISSLTCENWKSAKEINKHYRMNLKHNIYIYIYFSYV